MSLMKRFLERVRPAVASPPPPPPAQPGQRPVCPRDGFKGGTPVSIAGMVWQFAPFVPAPDPVWDRIYDGFTIKRYYEPSDVRGAAIRLLYAAYDLTPDEAAAVIVAADPRDLVPAVEVALLGPPREHRTWSDWMTSAFWSNGIDPESIPPEHRRLAVEQLQYTGRCMPEANFISSAEAAAARAGLPRPTAPAPAPPPPPET